MLRLEKYQNHLIPIDCVFHVEYCKEGTSFCNNEPTTIIYIFGPYGCSTIHLKGNQLDKFQKWISQFKDVDLDKDNAIWSQWPAHELKIGDLVYRGEIHHDGFIQTVSKSDDNSTVKIVTIQNLDSENQP